MGLLNSLKKRAFLSFEVIEAADRGDARAQKILQKAFDQGLSAEEHNNLRRQAYCLKANNGDAFAQYWMGFLCSVVDRNADAAVYWYECSANQGNIDAMKELYFGYGEFINTSDLGYGPVPFGIDEVKEVYWLRKAAELGDEEAIKELRKRK